MDIALSQKILLALLILAIISLYISYSFNSCLVISITKAIPKVSWIEENGLFDHYF